MLLLVTCGGSGEKDKFPPLPHILPAVAGKLTAVDRKRLEVAFAEARRKPEAAGQLAMLLHANALNEEARQTYRRILAIQPHSPQYAYLAARIGSSDGKNTLEAWEKALALNPQSIAVRVQFVKVLLKTGQFERAQPVVDGLLRLPTPEAQSYFLAGRVHQAQGNLDAATQFYVTACDINPRFGVAQGALAEVLRARRLPQQAAVREDLARRYRELEPPIPDPMFDQLTALRGPAAVDYESAQRWRAAGNLREAQRLYESALHHDPELKQARSSLVTLLLERSQYQAVMQQAEAARTAHASTTDLQVAEARALAGLKRLAEAEKLLQSIVPPDADAQFQLSLVQERLKKTKLAEASCRRAIDLDPQHREAHVSLARMVVNRNAKEAVAHLEAALHPEDARTALYLYLLSDAYFRMRNFETALARAKRAQELATALEQKQLLASAEMMIGKIVSAQSAAAVPIRTPANPSQ